MASQSFPLRRPRHSLVRQPPLLSTPHGRKGRRNLDRTAGEDDAAKSRRWTNWFDRNSDSPSNSNSPSPSNPQPQHSTPSMLRKTTTTMKKTLRPTNTTMSYQVMLTMKARRLRSMHWLGTTMDSSGGESRSSATKLGSSALDVYERLNLQKAAGKAKVLGTITGIGGAMLLTFLKGVEINIWNFHINLLHKNGQMGTLNGDSGSKLLGIFCGLGSCFCFALWLIIQAKMCKEYQGHYSSTALMSLMGAIQATVFALCVEKVWSQWRLRLNIRLLTAAYSGIVASGIMVIVIAWCVRMRGPLYASVFNPVMLVLVAIASSLMLDENLYLGTYTSSNLNDLSLDVIHDRIEYREIEDLAKPRHRFMSSYEQTSIPGSLSSINLKIINGMADNLMVHPEDHIAWFVESCNDSEFSRTLFFFVLLQSLLIKPKGEFSALFESVFPILKAEWESLVTAGDVLLDEFNSKLLDWDCSAFFDHLLCAHLRPLNAKVMVCIFWRLIQALISAVPSDILPVNSNEEADEIEAFFASRMNASIVMNLNLSIEQIRIKARWIQSVRQEHSLPDLIKQFAQRKG